MEKFVRGSESDDHDPRQRPNPPLPSHYGAGKLMRFPGKHLVNDPIHLHVKIHADRQG
jgi:hypothetical protein